MTEIVNLGAVRNERIQKRNDEILRAGTLTKPDYWMTYHALATHVTTAGQIPCTRESALKKAESLSEFYKSIAEAIRLGDNATLAAIQKEVTTVADQKIKDWNNQ